MTRTAKHVGGRLTRACAAAAAVCTGLRLTNLEATSLTVQWWFPPANPGSSNAWIGLFRAEGVIWGAGGSPHGECASGPSFRMLYRMLTSNATQGSLKFSGTCFSKLEDGLYVFSLQADYGRWSEPEQLTELSGLIGMA